LLWHQVLFRLPAVGPLIRKNAVARFASLLATLLESGVVFLESLAVVRRTVGNRLVRDAVAQAESTIAAGSDIAGPLSRSGVFDPVVAQMLAVGEESGQMESMLRQVAETYAEEVQIAATRAVAILEPVLIIAMAGVVGAVLYAVLLPILRMGNIF
jgi:type II secretory pathway component PulF